MKALVKVNRVEEAKDVLKQMGYLELKQDTTGK